MIHDACLIIWCVWVLTDIIYEQFHRFTTHTAVTQARRAFVHWVALPRGAEKRRLRSLASEGSGEQGARFQVVLWCFSEVILSPCRKGANVNFFDSKGKLNFIKTTSAIWCKPAKKAVWRWLGRCLHINTWICCTPIRDNWMLPSTPLRIGVVKTQRTSFVCYYSAKGRLYVWKD